VNWSDEVTLIKVEKEPDGEGYTRETETGRRTVYANRKSATRTEFYAAKQAGANIAIVFEVMGADYEDERKLEYTNPKTGTTKRYRVERDYTADGEKYELNCSLEAAPGSTGRKR